MSKTWIEIVRSKLVSFYERKEEIDDNLNELIGELASDNIKMTSKLTDDQNLQWTVNVNGQIFTITEKEVEEEKILFAADDYGNIVETGEKLDTKQALQNIIVEKLK